MSLLGVVLLGGVLVAGCSASGAESPPATSPGTGPTASANSSTVRPSPERTSTGDVVNDGYVLFWQAFINAQTNWDPNLPELARHASGQALSYARESVTAARTEGWVRVVRDGFQINSRVVRRQGDTARVSDVQDWSKWPLLVGNSDEVVPGSTPRQCITAGMVLRGGTWVVDTLTFAPNTC
ncbi:xylanase [Frankia sp. AgKG'84/4]|uniref:xylanase n=1 Tax=Frankia sp. AgKG'84/4 TaxID=573490 RepID=UPI00202A2E98|nr:xylanase [Frankia sp. AgKG'84/4]MCL9793858.1 xylanase [Frankia sp. AgKG'84/4]